MAFLNMLSTNIVVPPTVSTNGHEVEAVDTCKILIPSTMDHSKTANSVGQSSSTTKRGRQIRIAGTTAAPTEKSSGCNTRSKILAKRGSASSVDEITLPETHHEISASSMPVPLNTIMKGWQNVPKLHQYQPSDLQVVFHRRSGTEETVKTTSGGGGPVPVCHIDEKVLPQLSTETKEILFLEQLAGFVNASAPADKKMPLPPRTVAMEQELQSWTVETPNSKTFADKSVQYELELLSSSKSVQAQVEVSSLETQTVIQNDSIGSQTFKIKQKDQQHQMDAEEVVVNLATTNSQTDSMLLQSSACETDEEGVQSGGTGTVISTICDCSQTKVEENKKDCETCAMTEERAQELELQIRNLTELLQSSEQELVNLKKNIVNRKEENEFQQQTDKEETRKRDQEIKDLQKSNNDKQGRIVKYKAKIRKQEEDMKKVQKELAAFQSTMDTMENGVARLKTAADEKPGPILPGCDEDAIEDVLTRADNAISRQDETRGRMLKVEGYLATLRNSAANESGDIHVHSDI